MVWCGQILCLGVGPTSSQAAAVETESQSRPVPMVLVSRGELKLKSGAAEPPSESGGIGRRHNPYEATWTKNTSFGSIWSWVQSFNSDTV